MFLFVLQNGPMRFFFRISQSQKDLASAPVEKELSAFNTSSSVEQPSPKPPTSQLSSIVSRLTEPPLTKADNDADAEDLPPLTPIRAPETLTTTAFTQAPPVKTTAPDVQSHALTTVSTSTTSPSPTVAVQSTETLPTPIRVKSVSPVTTPCDTSCSQLLQTNLSEIATQNYTTLESNSKTHSGSKPMNPPTSDVTKELIRTTNLSSRISLPSLAAFPNDRTQAQTPSVPVTTTCEQPAPALVTQLPPLAAGTEIPTQQPTSDTASKDLVRISVAKTATYQSSTDSLQPQGQPSPIGERNLTESNHVLNSDPSDARKTEPLSSSSSSSSSSLPSGLVNSANTFVPEQEQPSEKFTANCKETALIECKDRLLIEVKSKTEHISDTTANISSDIASRSKPVLTKACQRTQMFARKSSLVKKVTPEASNNKTNLSTVKVPPSKDTKLPHVSHKAADKHSSNGLSFRKDKLEDSNKKSFGKELSNNSSDPEKRQEKQITSPKNTLLASNSSKNKYKNNNNNNKVPQQSLQVMKNNQQILKKNDEIMRCANTIKRTTQILQRKPQDILKTFNVQQRFKEDKPSSKKRCVLATNPVKRLLVKSVDATKKNDVEPATKKWRLGTENNHKLIHVDQKSSQFKDKCISNSSECHTSKIVTEKSSASDVAPIASKTNKSHFQSHAPMETIERQNNCNVQKDSLADKTQSCIPAQRSGHSSQPSGLSKNCDSQPRTPVSKPEILSPKSEATTPQVPMSSACNRIAQNPSGLVPAVAHSNANHRSQHPSLKRKLDGECNDVVALDLSASPRRQQQSAILSIAQTLARRHQHQCPPAPPPLSPLSPLSSFPVMSMPVRSPPPQLRITVPQHYRSGHPHQQRPSSLSSSSPSPPADTLPGCSRSGLQQQPLDIYPSHMLPPSAVMLRQQLEMQRLWNSGKHSPNPCVEWFNDAKSIKSFENFMKTLQQQQGNRNSSFYPYNNTASATNTHRK